MSPPDQDDDARDLRERTYLGDGVYAQESNGMILLTTLTGDRIYLETEVYRSLVEYAHRAWGI